MAQNGLDWKSCGGYCIYIYMCLKYVVVYISNMIYICIWGGGGGGIVYMCLKYVIVYISNMIYIYIKYAFLLQYFI